MLKLLLSFKKTAKVQEESSDRLILDTGDRSLTLEGLSAGLVAVIKTLGAGGDTEETLSDLILEKDDASKLPLFYYYIQQFTNEGLICHTLEAEGKPLATLVPFARPYSLEFQDLEPEKKYVLSRFAYCHNDNGEMVWESPFLKAQLSFADWRGAAMMGNLGKPQDANGLTEIPGISAETAADLLTFLYGAKMLVAEGGQSETTASQTTASQTTASQTTASQTIASQTTASQIAEGEALAQWEFHDLLFHYRTRRGRNPKIAGKTFRFLGKIKPLPAIKPQVYEDFIELYKPDLEKLKQTDLPFTRVLEERTSIRTQDSQPISAEQLGEFLYRAARVKEVMATEKYEVSRRPYPSGGASYDLELYLAIDECENIDPGFYHYCPQNHRLGKISAKNNQVETLLKQAGGAAGPDSGWEPQVLIVIAARFARVSWSYDAIAYSLTLKGVGVLQQTMYLVATAMNLSPCAVGLGDSDLFAAAAGTDYYAETSVGEFVISSKKKEF
ncbi:MAG: SagB/ThcOx family dehydrogenase [Oscillatoria sp. SIO1A7]|nr:SagB/ThcOx family dehydrogenase [Oscillatoria sp. SIO1A7]